MRMRRVAVVAPGDRMREVLVILAAGGVIDLSGPLGGGDGPALEALRRLERGPAGASQTVPALAPDPPDIAALEREGARDLLAGEVELERRKTGAVAHGRFRTLVGWAPAPALESLRRRLEPAGASLLELRTPPGVDPPTLLAPVPAAEPFRPLVSTYGAIPYDDVDPTPFAAFTFCLMFGMMFGDVGDGALVVLAALWLRRARGPRLRPVARVWPLIAAAGASSVIFGALYGETFGPTRLLPVLWLAPLDEPTQLLTVAVVLGACLLVVGHLIGIVNRLREGGRALALTTPSGVPGLVLLTGAALTVIGAVLHADAPQLAGLGLAVAALAAIGVGLRAEAGSGASAVAVVAIGLLDAVLRLFSNVFSFARLAAFGLMHAAIGQVVLHAAGSLRGTGVGDLAAAVVFSFGWAVAFALEGLVVSVQALRLEYYELFSRVLLREGRRFAPWSLPLLIEEESR